jgi:hypothetical protein
MAVPSTSTFLRRFPEFSEQSLSVIEGALAEAGRITPAASWGAVQPDGIVYLTAHILATRTMQIGQQVGVLSGAPNGELLNASLYGQEYKRLLNSLTLSGFAL